MLLLQKNVMVICCEELVIKDLNHSVFFTRVIKTMELCTTELFIFEIKPSVKKNCYNGILKLRESEDIIAACSCPSGSSVKCL